MSTEYWILKCPKLISYTEKQRLKIQSRGYTLKDTVLKTKTNKNNKIKNKIKRKNPQNI